METGDRRGHLYLGGQQTGKLPSNIPPPHYRDSFPHFLENNDDSFDFFFARHRDIGIGCLRSVTEAAVFNVNVRAVVCCVQLIMNYLLAASL